MLAAPEANFEETFGENKAADAWFVLGSELKEPDKQHLKYPPSKILSEFEILANEVLDKDILEKSFERLVEWLTENQNEKYEPQFLQALSGKIDGFLSNVDEQVAEMNYNSISKVRINLRKLLENILVKDSIQEYDEKNGLMKKIDTKFYSLISKLAEESKKIKKKKNFEKKQKLFEVERKERYSSIDEANSLLANDLKKDAKKEEMKKEEYKKEVKMEHKTETKYPYEEDEDIQSKIEVYD